MKLYIFVTNILFILVSGDKDSLSFLSWKFVDLTKCIEQHESMNIIRYDGDEMMKKAIAMVITEKVLKRNVSCKFLDSKVSLFIEQLIDAEFIELGDNQILKDEMEISLKKILEDCADDNENSNTSSSINRSSSNDRKSKNLFKYVTLPYIANESPEISLLLDYILVNWPYYRENMFSLKLKRKVLWSYAEDALRVLVDAYTANFQQIFQYILRNFWRHRADLYFDIQSVPLPYINHIYSLDFPTPHMQGDNRIFFERINDNIASRNPPAARSKLKRILNVHALSNSSLNITDVFSYYEENGMTSADYYFEIHINQFYRILFIFLELQERAFETNENDISANAVPEDLQAIFYNDNIYRNYLLRRRSYELNNTDVSNIYRINLEQNNRSREEDLIMLFWLRNESRIRARTTSTTVRAIKESKKGSVLVNEHGKNFPKKPKKNVESSDEQPGMSNTNYLEDSRQTGVSSRYFGYFSTAAYSGYDSDPPFQQYPFAIDESSAILRDFDDLTFVLKSLFG